MSCGDYALCSYGLVTKQVEVWTADGQRLAYPTPEEVDTFLNFTGGVNRLRSPHLLLLPQ